MNNAKLIYLSDVTPQPVEWLWYPYIPIGKITIMHGDGGEGKTTLALNLAAILSRGDKLPCCEYGNIYSPIEPITVIYQTAEDGLADTIKPRLLAAGADCSRIITIDETENVLSMSDERIEKTIKATGARLLILDPIQGYLGANVDINRANEVRPIFSQLGNIAEKYNCAILLIGHLGKCKQKAAYRGLGSVDIVAAARSVLMVGKPLNDPAKRIICHSKSNLAPTGHSLKFSISDGKVEWGEFVSTVADEIFGEVCIARDTKVNTAKDIILEHLTDGPQTANDMFAVIQQEIKIGNRSIETARTELREEGKIEIKKKDGVFVWQLTQQGESK